MVVAERARPWSSSSLRVPRRAGSAQVSEVQRARMLAATVQVVGELGYERMSVARVTARAGVSRRTFYDLFQDREACFLGAFVQTAARARVLVCEAALGERDWRARVRGGLGALLGFFSDEPLAGRLLVVDALKAGPVVLERRAVLVQELIGVVDQGRGLVRGGRQVAPLTGEGVVGAVLAVVHARLLAGSDSGSGARRGGGGGLVELLNPLVAMVVQPYLGVAAAERELARPVGARRPVRRGPVIDPLEGLDMRLTYRTLRVLAAIAAVPGASNRTVAQAAGVADQGQISKLLARLEGLGLICNRGVGHLKGEPNAWELTARGIEVEQAIRARSAITDNEGA
jgi:AcrR family transcriptional regulator